jgi:hypothetical protein
LIFAFAFGIGIVYMVSEMPRISFYAIVGIDTLAFFGKVIVRLVSLSHA